MNEETKGGTAQAKKLYDSLSLGKKLSFIIVSFLTVWAQASAADVFKVLPY